MTKATARLGLLLLFAGYACALPAVPQSPQETPVASQESQQEGGIMGPHAGVQYRPGPLHFCAGHVAIEVAADERIGWQEGPDFDLYFLVSSRGGFGLYQGHHPQRGTSAGPATISGRPAERLQDADGGYSYLVQVSDSPLPTFVHLYGAAWKGDERDATLLARLRIGAPADLGCERPTFSR
jgi:hypothetical protein